METSEELQIASYGIGGYYDPHLDGGMRREDAFVVWPHQGNRMATWLSYASDVELGGATVFTKANLTLYPQKGSAAFWHNLLNNGEIDERTWHAACPVLSGTKLGEQLHIIC